MDDTKGSRETWKPQSAKNSEFEPKYVDSVALTRLIEEVRNRGDAEIDSPTAYNRTHNRHNR